MKRSIFFAESDLNHGQATLLLELIKKVLLDVEKDLPTGGYISSRPNTPGPDSSDRFDRRPRHPGQFKILLYTRHQLSAKSAPQKTLNRDKAEFATEVRKSS